MKTSKYKEAIIKAGYHPSPALIAAVEAAHELLLNPKLIATAFKKVGKQHPAE